MNIIQRTLQKWLGVSQSPAVVTPLESGQNALLEKALGGGVKESVKSLFYDPLFANYAIGGQYEERPSNISFRMLKQMARRNPIVAAIINTRLNQVTPFTRQADIMEKSQSRPLGYKVIHRFKSPKQMSEGERRFAQNLEDFITDCGYTDSINKQTGRKRDGFTTFTRKLVRDRLTLDQLCFEIVRNRAGEPAEMWAVDASTIRLATPESMRERGIAYVQVLDGRVVNEYTHDELAFVVANPVTDLDFCGYGFSELEMLIHIVASQIFAEQYNQKFFSQGLGIQGILNIQTKEGKIPDDVLQAFRAQFQAQNAGVANAWKTPVTNADKLEWINLKGSNRDMEYSAWVDYLVKVTCAVYQIDPAEINFDMRGGAAGQAPMFESSPEAKLKHSRDKGLRPLLDFIADYMTEYFVKPYDKNFIFTFVGLDEKDESEIIKMRTDEIRSYKSLDEIREEAGLEPFGEERGGHLILDPQYIAFLQQKEMAAQTQTVSGEDEDVLDLESEPALSEAKKSENSEKSYVSGAALSTLEKSLRTISAELGELRERVMLVSQQNKVDEYAALFDTTIKELSALISKSLGQINESLQKMSTETTNGISRSLTDQLSVLVNFIAQSREDFQKAVTEERKRYEEILSKSHATRDEQVIEAIRQFDVVASRLGHVSESVISQVTKAISDLSVIANKPQPPLQVDVQSAPLSLNLDVKTPSGRVRKSGRAKRNVDGTISFDLQEIRED